MRWGNTILIAAHPHTGEDVLSVIVNGGDLVAGKVAVPRNALALTGVNGLNLLRPA